MVFGHKNALLAAASLLSLAAANAVAPPAGGEVTITKTITNTHTICPATSKPPVCKPTDVSGGIGGNHGGNGGNNGGNGGNNGGNGGHGGNHGGLGSGNSPEEDAALWQKWLDQMSRDAAEASKTSKPAHVPWTDWPAGPTGLPPFDDECDKAHDGLPENKCNKAGSRSKWCDGKSVDTDYYKDYDSGNTCKYTLEITNGSLAYDGAPVLSFLVNGQSPGPVIECNWGDWVEIDVINKLQNNATTIHWHGVHQKATNDQDGVPGISECGIAPGESRTYAWRASSYGTAWYHSHLLAQYGDGIRGPIIIHGPTTADYEIDMGHVMITDTFPAGTAFAQAERIARFGQNAVVTSNYLLNGNNKSPDMTTGKHALWKVQKGKTHLFRFINGAAQEAYSVKFDNHKMTVISSDFVPIEPYQTEWLNIAPGQRYDVILKADQPSANYFLRAATQTGCPSPQPGNNGLKFANGIIQYSDAQLTLPNSTFGNRTEASFKTCNDEPLAKLVPHLQKTAGTSALFAAGQRDLPAGRVAVPGANQSVVQWFINNNFMNVSYTEPTLQTLAEQPTIFSNGVQSTNSSSVVRNAIVLQQKDTWYYFIVRNEFFAAHPLHLHGHDASILGQGNGVPDTSALNFKNPARRDTVMLPGANGPQSPGGPGPLGYTVIGFESDNPGAWLMHCHIVWHVEGGMALQFVEAPSAIGAGKYANKPEFKKECAAMKKYEENPANRKHAGQSGLKRDASVAEMFGADVVRRDIHRHSHRHL